MKRIIVVLVVIFSSCLTNAQSLKTNGEVILALGKIENNQPHILVFLGQPIDSSLRKKITTLIAYYKTDSGNLGIDTTNSV